MYHDVVEPGRGSADRSRSRYELERPLFERHLAAIAAAGRSPSNVADIRPGKERPAASAVTPLYLTFDDGDASAIPVGKLLADAGWVGHFFIPSDFIGRPGYLDAAGVAALDEMGHVIGSHSCSHGSYDAAVGGTPPRGMDSERRGPQRDHREQSLLRIRAGGYWSTAVARAAAWSGIEVLFTSEPIVSIHECDGSLLLGRYSVLAGMSDGPLRDWRAARSRPAFVSSVGGKQRASPSRSWATTTGAPGQLFSRRCDASPAHRGSRSFRRPRLNSSGR